MLVEKNFLGLRSRNGKHKIIPARQPLSALLRAEQLSNYGKRSGSRRTRDLIKILLGHGARAARINLPRAHIAINVYFPNGQRALRIKMARQDWL